MHRAYRFRAYPTPEQEPLLRQTFGSVRWVWNRFVADQRARDTRGEHLSSYFENSAHLTLLKHSPEYQWLNTVPSVPLQETLRHLARAQQNWRMGRAHQPTFKRLRRKHEAAEFTRSAFRWDATSPNTLQDRPTEGALVATPSEWLRPIDHHPYTRCSRTNICLRTCQ
jgi:putative transposase